MTKLEALKKKLQELVEDNKTTEIDWEARKSFWLESINKLYLDISEWLKEFKNIKISYQETDIIENYLGSYKTRVMKIYAGNELIYLRPKGSIIVGAKGRIDITGKNFTQLLILDEDNNWKIAVREPKITYWELNEDSFIDLISKIIE